MSGDILDEVDGDQFSAALDLSMARGYLEQLGADRDVGKGGGRDE